MKFNLKKLLIGVALLGTTIGVIGRTLEKNNHPKYWFEGIINNKHVRLTDYSVGRELEIVENPSPPFVQIDRYSDYNKDGALDSYFQKQIGDGFEYITKEGVSLQAQSEYNNYLTQIRRIN